MKLRSYLRGIGLGILISSALFISIGFNNKNEMTDAQIKARAKELGMTEKTVLSDLSSEEEIESTMNMVPSTTESIEETTEQTTEQPETNQSTEYVETDEPIEYTEIEPTDNETIKNITIVVNKGDGSGTVSGKLLEAGLIDNAKEFDHYLMENGYDRRIRAGNHEIPSDATMEQMAKLLCN